MINSQFLRLAQQYGLSKVPQTGQELMAALQGMLTADQLELMQYLFMDPMQFQESPINQIIPAMADTGAQPAGQPAAQPMATGQDEPAPAKDRAPTQVTQPSAQEPGTAVTPNTPANQAAAPTGAAVNAGNSGFNANGTLRLAWNDPDAPGLMAKYPGRYTLQPPPAGMKHPWDTGAAPAGATTPPAGTPATPATPTTPAATAPAVTRPWTPPVNPAPTGSVGTPIAGADKSGAAGYWDPGDATHPPRFIKSS